MPIPDFLQEDVDMAEQEQGAAAAEPAQMELAAVAVDGAEAAADVGAVGQGELAQEVQMARM